METNYSMNEVTPCGIEPKPLTADQARIMAIHASINEMNAVKIGDKLNLPANYRGEQIPVLEWTVVKENAKSFKVCGTVNAGLPNWRSFNLFLSKTTGKITA